jgi:hypothetical protein
MFIDIKIMEQVASGVGARCRLDACSYIASRRVSKDYSRVLCEGNKYYIDVEDVGKFCNERILIL